jgi:hypothetical protein
MPRREGLPNAVIAIWGKIQLEPLGASDVSTVASGGTVRGLLVSFLGDLQRSAKAGVPVYRLGGGPGYLWVATFNSEGRGVLRFLTIDASQIAPPSVATTYSASQPSPPFIQSPNAVQPAGQGAPTHAQQAPQSNQPTRYEECERDCQIPGHICSPTDCLEFRNKKEIAKDEYTVCLDISNNDEESCKNLYLSKEELSQNDLTHLSPYVGCLHMCSVSGGSVCRSGQCGKFSRQNPEPKETQSQSPSQSVPGFIQELGKDSPIAKDLLSHGQERLQTLGSSYLAYLVLDACNKRFSDRFADQQSKLKDYIHTLESTYLAASADYLWNGTRQKWDQVNSTPLSFTHLPDEEAIENCKFFANGPGNPITASPSTTQRP